jgi:hypothetical protein
MSILAVTTVQFPVSDLVPLALGFFGLGTGYLIYGPQELFGMKAKNRGLDVATGIWGVWMPGFMQFLAGMLIWIGLLFFHVFREAPLYMAALAFTAYGVHWFALGMGRMFGGDARTNGFMSIPFALISILGIIVFFHNHDNPVGGLFIGLTGVYVSEFFASLFVRVPPEPAPGDAAAPAERTAAPPKEKTPIGELGERALGFFHLGTGLWLMYLTWAVVLNFTCGYNLTV